MKRLFDIAVAGAGLLATAPLLAGLAIAVRLDSPGPALFRQTRVGRGRRPFRLAKLRTMTARNDGPELTAAADPRVTRIGAFLRRTKLDELPQLWNVLRGDMSIVGPRPEVERYVTSYRPEWLPLLSVRPGITDLASLAFRDEEAVLGVARDRERAYREVVMPLKLALALEGVKRASVMDDLMVIAQTIAAVVRPREAEVIAEARRRIAQLEESS